MKHTSKLFLIGTLLILLMIGIPLLVLQAHNQQETRSRAAASTTLYFLPTTNQANPLQKTVGDDVSLDILVNPGNNLPSLIKLIIPYDAIRLQPASNPFTVNTAAFPTTLEGPFIDNGRILISLSVGSDPTKAIATVTKVGTINFRAIGPTANEPTSIAFANNSNILSVGANDAANENILSSSNPAFVFIKETQTSLTPEPTNLPTASPTVAPSITPTTSPTLALTPTQAPTATPTLIPSSTRLLLNVFLHGIGASGDNANPTDNSLSNKNPKNPTRSVDVEIYNSLNQLTASSSGSVTYASSSGGFVGTIDLLNPLSQGIYTVRVKEPTHLRKLIAGIQTLTPGQINNLPAVTLVAGDVNGDNTINIIDYNLILGCYSDLVPATSCTDNNKLLTDLDDDGNVNQVDYNLFLREITVQSGQ